MESLIKRIFIIFRQKSSIHFKLGLLLLLVNPLIGLGISPAVVLIFTLYYKNPKTGIFYGAVIYAASWVVMGLGFLLSGKAGYHISRDTYKQVKRYFRSKK